MSDKITQLALTGSKSLIRKQILSQRIGLLQKQVLVRSDKIYNNLFKTPQVLSSKSVLLYIPINNEVATLQIFENFKKNNVDVYLPTFISPKIGYAISKFGGFANLELGPLGISQPKNPQAVDIKIIDIAIIPGVAFDRKGTRLGYGKGVYDKLLAGFGGLKIGLAYDFQIVDRLPRESHDLTMDLVINDK